jgi:dTDP-4-amino-4,6-dideoxygalactose transaminase
VIGDEMSNFNTSELLPLPSDQNASGRSFGEEEIALLSDVIRSGTLFSVSGTFVKTLEKRFAEMLGVKHAYACASGTAALHTAIASINPEPGDEIVTSPITDMGALAPILYQGAIPVFADVEPRTCNISAETIAPCLSERTRAVIVTHLFGNPCDMHPIMALAERNKIPVIEDCAQSFLARYDNQLVGTFGKVASFSLQQGKHITTGEGGIVVTNDDDIARRMFLFINKAWGYGDANPDHYFLALNYRMSELQGAVAVAQLPKLGGGVEQRIRMADKLTRTLKSVKGIVPPWIHHNSTHTYWKYCIRVERQEIPGGPVALAKDLKDLGVHSVPRYIQKPAFMCEVFQKQRTFGNSRYPFTLARPEALDYRPTRFPGTFSSLEDILVLPWNERYTEEHVDYIATSIARAAEISRGLRQ